MFTMAVVLKLIQRSLSQEAVSLACEPGKLLGGHATTADLKGGGGNLVPKKGRRSMFHGFCEHISDAQV